MATKTFINPTAWEGIDANLETSLFEYNFVARQFENRDYPTEWQVLYKIGEDSFDTGYKQETELNDLVNGNDWMNEEDIISFLSYTGMTKDEWIELPFTSKFSDLLNYYGYENLMGSSYSVINKAEVIERFLINYAELKKLTSKKYGHTVESATNHLLTDYSDGFTICKNCGSFYDLGKGFKKHLSNGCLNCEGEEKHKVYFVNASPSKYGWFSCQIYEPNV